MEIPPAELDVLVIYAALCSDENERHSNKLRGSSWNNTNPKTHEK